MAYPYLSDVIRDLTGWELLIPIPMFGLMVGTALLVAMWILKLELRRLHECGGLGFARRRVKGDDGQFTDSPIRPQEIAGDLAMIALITGIIGARAFSILEYPSEFLADPWGTIFSRTGFTYYGGMIFGTVAGVIFVNLKRLPIRVVLDAVAPAIMIGYGIGRLGCQISGDGDWGIASNLALKPSWIPTWFWAQTYQNNIAGITIEPPGVYPTPLYEMLMALMAFAILWAIRRHPFRRGWLFSVFLILCGVERFLIELIRVNTESRVFGFVVTQAQLISLILMLAGVVGVILFRSRPMADPCTTPAMPS